MLIPTVEQPCVFCSMKLYNRLNFNYLIWLSSHWRSEIILPEYRCTFIVFAGIEEATKYSKTSIYRAPIYRVPRFTVPQFYPPKTSLISAKYTPICRASRFTGPNSFPPRSPVNRGFTVLLTCVVCKLLCFVSKV